jgi:hypothetical protein
LALLTSPASALADDVMRAYEQQAAELVDYDSQVELAQMATDTVLVRPLGIVSTVAGFGLFVISVPFAALGGNTGEAWHTLVGGPAKFTFKRPLGEFD